MIGAYTNTVCLVYLTARGEFGPYESSPQAFPGYPEYYLGMNKTPVAKYDPSRPTPNKGQLF